jgi:hypothetical protein
LCEARELMIEQLGAAAHASNNGDPEPFAALPSYNSL